MKKYLVFFVATLSLAFATTAFSHPPRAFDLQQEFKNKRLDVHHRALTLINEEGHSGIRLSKDYGEGIAWLKGVEFSDGVIEFDVRGENIKQHSFVGIAFHGKDNETFDAIYLRPFQFQETDPVLRSHSIQYISLPDFGWRVLREKFPSKFEQPIDPSPDPNAWVHIKLVVKGPSVSTYVNGSAQPSLVIEKVTRLSHGSVGLYVADTSGGDFANLVITNAK